MKEKIDLSIIIPAYNEEKKIKKDISEASKFIENAPITGEIIVSTDGVTDRTNTIVEELQKEYDNLFLLWDKDKIGKGAAIQKAVAQARGKFIMFADAGLCVPYSYALQGLEVLLSGNDCAIGSRAEDRSKILKKQPLYRVIGSRIFKTLIHAVLQIPSHIKDTQCGFKLYKRRAAKKVFSELKTKRMMFDIEIILRLKKHGFTMEPFPVEWKNDLDTKFDPVKGSWDILKDLYQIKVVHRL